MNASRRRLLLGALFAPTVLSACSAPRPPLRVGTNIWIGYESLYVAESEGILAKAPVRLVTMRNASDVQQALHAGMLEAATLSLDEALNVVDQGLDLRVVLVMDVSNGADAVLAGPGIRSPEDLRGKRVGVETNAMGALMLQACLEAAGLGPQDVRIVDIGVDRHAAAFRGGEVDAVVTFEPVRSELLREGAAVVFDSSEVPDRIVDVLVVTPEVLERDPDAIRSLVAGHFKALLFFRDQPLRAAAIMRARQRSQPEDIVKAFDGVKLPDLAENRRLLGAGSAAPALEASAERLVKIMVAHDLLAQPVAVRGLFDGRFLPAA